MENAIAIEDETKDENGLQDPIRSMICKLHLCEKRILINTVAYCEQKLKGLQQQGGEQAKN